MSWLLLGYDVESAEPDGRTTRQFIDTLRRVHGELEAQRARLGAGGT